MRKFILFVLLLSLMSVSGCLKKDIQSDPVVTVKKPIKVNEPPFVSDEDFLPDSPPSTSTPTSPPK